MVGEELGRGRPLAECGLAVESFCQTWLRNTQAVGDAQFSVMSPHFQTRFFVSDVAALLRVPGVREGHVASYARMVHKLTQDMAADYGVNGGGQSFVNLDGLLAVLPSIEHALAKPPPAAVVLAETPEAALLRVFEELDADGSGTLELLELGAVLQAAYADFNPLTTVRLFKCFDGDTSQGQDRKIDFAEFRQTLLEMFGRDEGVTLESVMAKLKEIGDEIKDMYAAGDGAEGEAKALLYQTSATAHDETTVPGMLELVAGGKVDDDTLVWAEGMDEWQTWGEASPRFGLVGNSAEKKKEKRSAVV